MATPTERVGSRTSSFMTFCVGTAVAMLVSLAPNDLSEAAGDVGWVMGVMGASLYWSTVITSFRPDIGSPRYASRLRAQVSFTLRTCIVVAIGLACIAIGTVLQAFPSLEGASKFAYAGAFGLFAIMLLRMLTIVGALTTIVDLRMDGTEPTDDPGNRWSSNARRG